MFEEHFGFDERPFGKTPDPAFLYESRQHAEALARLEFAVEEKDLALLVGDIGCGKTTLSRALIDRLDGSRPVVLLINPRVTPSQLLRAIAAGLDLEPKYYRHQLLDQIHHRLYELYEEERSPVVMIDEAQLIPSKATFDELRLLTNFQLDDENLLSLLLIGQPELEVRLDRKAYEPLRQRIGLRYRLGALSEDETRRYVEHRISVAGGDHNPFLPEAITELHSISRGIPRLINNVATTALLDAFSRGEEIITVEMIRSAGHEHRLVEEERAD